MVCGWTTFTLDEQKKEILSVLHWVPGLIKKILKKLKNLKSRVPDFNRGLEDCMPEFLKLNSMNFCQIEAIV